ncbi:MAG: hypothetical protein Q8P50_18705 [Bacillota bacterium]|nr:hypothetical protein [Bacillota bacterium]
MVGVNVPGIIVTVALVGPVHAGWTLLAIVLQEAGRLVLATGFGGEISEMWVGGFFSLAEATGARPLMIAMAGPLWSLALATCFGGLDAANAGLLLNPATRHRRPLGVALLKLAVGSMAVALYQVYVR